MAVPTIKKELITTGPGLLRFAPLGTTVPTIAVTASKFSHTWDTAWKQVGATDEGAEESYEVSTEDVEVAESLYAAKTVTTGKNSSLSFAMAHIHKETWRLSQNADASTMVTTGTGATSLTTFTPPLAGGEVRHMLAWESEDSDQLLIVFAAFQTGNVTVGHRKGSDKSLLTVEFRMELPDSTVSDRPYKRYFAGDKYAAALQAA